MVLYGPAVGASPDKKIQWEIILSRPCSESLSAAYSLYRASSQTEAEEKFNAFLKRLPIFVMIVKEVNYIFLSSQN